MFSHRIYATFLFVVLLIVGFYYRLLLASFAYKPLAYDMLGYQQAAERMLSGVFVADCCLRNYGYSAFLSFVYVFFNPQNLFAVQVAQSFLDVLVGVMLFFIGRRTFGKTAGNAAFVFYLANPFTSSYTGLRLAEILAVFLLMLMIVTVNKSMFLQSKRYWFAWGMIAGLLVWVKLSFLFLPVAIGAALVIFIFRGWYRLTFVMITLGGFLMGSMYSLIANYHIFGSLRVTPPHGHPGVQLYLSYVIPRAREIDTQFQLWGPNPQEFTDIMYEFASAPDEKERSQIDATYMSRFRERTKHEWPILLRNTVRNIVWLWDMQHLYYYTDPFYPADRLPLRLWIISTFGLFFTGIFCFVKRYRSQILTMPLFLTTLVFFLYMNTFFPLFNTESRYSLYFLPFLYLWAGYGVSELRKIHWKGYV